MWTIEEDPFCMAELALDREFNISQASQLHFTKVILGTHSGDLLEWDTSTVQDYVPTTATMTFTSSHHHSSKKRLDICRTFQGHLNSISCLQFDDSLLISGSYDGTLRIWDLPTGLPLSTLGQVLLTSGTKQAFSALQFHDHALATGRENGRIQTWDTRTGRSHRSFVFPGSSGCAIKYLKFNSSELLTGSENGVVALWDLRQGQVIESWGLDGPLVGLEWTSRYLIGSTWDFVSLIPRGLEETRLLRAPGARLSCLSLSEENNMLLAGDTRGWIHKWSLD